MTQRHQIQRPEREKRKGQATYQETKLVATRVLEGKGFSYRQGLCLSEAHRHDSGRCIASSSIVTLSSSAKEKTHQHAETKTQTSRPARPAQLSACNGSRNRKQMLKEGNRPKDILDAVKLDMTHGHLHMTGVSGRSAQRTAIVCPYRMCVRRSTVRREAQVCSSSSIPSSALHRPTC